MNFLQELNEAELRKQTLTTLVKLPVPRKDLQPVFSSKTLEDHYDILSKGYTKKAGNNDSFIDGGAFLHNLLWSQLQAPKKNNIPEKFFKERIEAKYDSFDSFKTQLIERCLSCRGSAWVILDSKLQLSIVNNHKIVENAIMVVDMWEHAFFHDYRTNKEAYVNDFISIIDWNIVTDRYLDLRG